MDDAEEELKTEDVSRQHHQQAEKQAAEDLRLKKEAEAA